MKSGSETTFLERADRVQHEEVVQQKPGRRWEFPGVQCLGFWALTAKGMGQIPCQEIKTP